MVTKNAIAKKKYGVKFDECSAGQKAQVSKLYKQVNGETSAPATRSTRTTSAPRSSKVRITFARHGVAPTSKDVDKDSTVEEALSQAGISIASDKEGITTTNGSIVMLKDTVVAGTEYLIVVGVDSQ